MTDVTGGGGPTRPRWTLTYKVAGESRTRDFDVSRETEARTRLAVDEPAAYDIEAAFTEVPI